jgi:hypothetical protein
MTEAANIVQTLPKTSPRLGAVDGMCGRRNTTSHDNGEFQSLLLAVNASKSLEVQISP